jgi:hypothetical protein
VSVKILFILECGHVELALSVSGDHLWCGRCATMKLVKDVHVYEWHARCTSSGCTMSRYCGLSKDLARFLARGHSARRPSHLVNVEYEPNPVAIRVMEKRMKGGLL